MNIPSDAFPDYGGWLPGAFDAWVAVINGTFTLADLDLVVRQNNNDLRWWLV